jgi:methylmalonyl-CoA mutase N-terminal domain/subunit
MSTHPKPAIRPVINESGLAIQPLYTADDLAASGGVSMLGAPGQYPFTRGIHPLMYRKQPFTMRQYTGFATAATPTSASSS